jgi:hypothetical protein
MVLVCSITIYIADVSLPTGLGFFSAVFWVFFKLIIFSLSDHMFNWFFSCVFNKLFITLCCLNCVYYIFLDEAIKEFVMFCMFYFV